MGTVCDENIHINAEDTIEKLQSLVKSLEHQNEVLKSKQSLEISDSQTLKSNDSVLPNNGQLKNTNKKTENNNIKAKDMKKGVLDGIDLLDFSEQDSEPEDLWLYTSTKSSEKSNISPYKWVRQDLEKRTPEVENVRKSLVFRLDDVTRMVRSPSSNKNSGMSPYQRGPSEEQPRSRRSLDYMHNGNDFESDEAGMKLNSGTFRIKKKPSSGLRTSQNSTENSSRSYDDQVSRSLSTDPVASPTSPSPYTTGFGRTYDSTAERVRDIHNLLRETYVASDRNGNQGNSGAPHSSMAARSLSLESSTDNSLDSPRDGGGEVEFSRINDVIDVQVLARMQEDSLRKSMNSPAQFNHRKVLSRSVNNGYGANRANPSTKQSESWTARNTETGSPRRPSNYSLSSLSSSASPAPSPYGSNQDLETEEPGQDNLRRSMPNLAKSMQMSLASHPSDTEINESPHHVNTGTFTRNKPGMSRYGSGGLAPRTSSAHQRIQSPAGGLRNGSASPQSSAYNVRNVSPVRAGRMGAVSQPQQPTYSPSPDGSLSPPDSPPIQIRRRGAPPGTAPIQVRNVSPVRQPPDGATTNASPTRTYQARNVSPGWGAPTPRGSGLASQQRRTGLQTPQSRAYARATSPGQALPQCTSAMGGRTYSGNTLQQGQPRGSLSGTQTLTLSRTAPSEIQNSVGAAKGRPSALSGLPSHRSTAIPRAGSSSKLPAPRTTAIPTSRRAALFSSRNEADTSWKDGCY